MVKPSENGSYFDGVRIVLYVCMYVCIVCMYVLMYVLMYDYIYVLFVCRG